MCVVLTFLSFVILFFLQWISYLPFPLFSLIFFCLRLLFPLSYLFPILSYFLLLPNFSFRPLLLIFSFLFPPFLSPILPTSSFSSFLLTPSNFLSFLSFSLPPSLPSSFPLSLPPSLSPSLPPSLPSALFFPFLFAIIPCFSPYLPVFISLPVLVISFSSFLHFFPALLVSFPFIFHCWFLRWVRELATDISHLEDCYQYI